MAELKNPYDPNNLEDPYATDLPGGTPPTSSTQPVGTPVNVASTEPTAPPQNPSQVINSQNPTANPDLPYVQAGDTGGYIDGVGVTVAPGHSLTPAQYQAYIDEAIEMGVPADWAADWLSRNPWDSNRMLEAYNSEGGGDSSPDDVMIAGSGGSGSMRSLRKTLESLWGGGMNQNVINSRMSNVRDDLNRQRKSRLRTNQAALAERGLIGSGPEEYALGSLETDMADIFSNAATGIYADESQAADRRMMDALQMSSALESGDLDRALGYYNADIGKMLGLGNLALGNTQAMNNYNLGLADFGLRRDMAINEFDQQDLNQLIQMVEQLLNASGISQGITT
jgi:hypothetical protein